MPSSSQSDSVFLPEIDGEHNAILRTAGDLQTAVDTCAPLLQIQEILRHLLASTDDHFAHEERLMLDRKYQFLAWHKRQHNTARRQFKHYAALIEAGDTEAAKALATFLTAWLHDHASITDRMMAAFLRNQKRALS